MKAKRILPLLAAAALLAGCFKDVSYKTNYVLKPLAQAQTVDPVEPFEGLKAYRGDGGEAYLFRPDMNAKRANNSNRRLCIPEIPEEDFVEAVRAVVDIDRDWIPSDPGTSLYIRPFVIATDEFLSVAPSKNYLFIIILSPSGAYYELSLIHI